MKLRIALAALLAGLVGGCSSNPTAEVSGSVLLDNKPLAGVQVRFVPVSNVNLGSLSATTDAEGKFSISRDAAGGAAQPGKYTVVIGKTTEVPAADGGMPTVKEDYPEIAQQLQKSPIEADLKPGPNALEPFKFTGRKAAH